VLKNSSLTQNKIKDSKHRKKRTRKAHCRPPRLPTTKVLLPMYLYQTRVQSNRGWEYIQHKRSISTCIDSDKRTHQLHLGMYTSQSKIFTFRHIHSFNKSIGISQHLIMTCKHQHHLRILRRHLAKYKPFIHNHIEAHQWITHL